MSPTTNLGECAKPAGRERNNLTGLRYPLIQHIIYIICAASSISAGLSLDWSAQLKQWSTLQRDYQQHPAAPCMCTPMLLQCVFLLDALIDSSPQDVRQGRHPAAWQLILENVLNQLAGKRNSLTGLRYPLMQHIIYIISKSYPRKEWPLSRWHDCAASSISAGLSLDWSAASGSTMHVHTHVVAVCFSVGCSDWQLTARCQAGPPPSSLTTNLGECAKPAGRERNNLTGLRYPPIQHIIYIISKSYPRKEWPLSRWHDCAASSISAGLSLDWSAQLKQWSTLQRDYQQHPAAPCMCTPMLLQCVFLLDALIDSSPQDVRQGRHPAAWQLILENVLNQPAGERNSLTGLRYPLMRVCQFFLSQVEMEKVALKLIWSLVCHEFCIGN